MKKLSLISILPALALFLSSCTTEVHEPTSTTTTTTHETTAVTRPADTTTTTVRPTGGY
ncbi:MAG: hypothetical protein ACJ8M1_08010 [Chthoniobacterales bacterium]